MLAVIDSLALRWYSLIMMGPILTGIWLMGRLAAARGLEAAFVPDLAIWLVPAGIIGARAYEVFVLQ